MNRILLVDDDHELRRALVDALANAGYPTTGAANGAEALRAFRREPSDVVITDLLMPERDGFETLLDLRAETPSPKVLVITGGGDVLAETYLRMARRMGATQVLAKPFSIRDLLAAVKDLTESSAG